MKKLDLNQYSDREIFLAILDLPALKCLSIMQGVGSAIERAASRGSTLSKGLSDNEIEEMFRSFREGEDE